MTLATAPPARADFGDGLKRALEDGLGGVIRKGLDSAGDGIFGGGQNQGRPQTPERPQAGSTQPRPQPSRPAGPSAADVLTAQTKLNAFGFDTGKPDGRMGPKTRGAIKAFERSLGREEKGVVNAALLELLEKYEWARMNPGSPPPAGLYADGAPPITYGQAPQYGVQPQYGGVPSYGAAATYGAPSVYGAPVPQNPAFGAPPGGGTGGYGVAPQYGVTQGQLGAAPTYGSAQQYGVQPQYGGQAQPGLTADPFANAAVMAPQAGGALGGLGAGMAPAGLAPQGGVPLGGGMPGGQTALGGAAGLTAPAGLASQGGVPLGGGAPGGQTALGGAAGAMVQAGLAPQGGVPLGGGMPGGQTPLGGAAGLTAPAGLAQQGGVPLGGGMPGGQAALGGTAGAMVQAGLAPQGQAPLGGGAPGGQTALGAPAGLTAPAGLAPQGGGAAAASAAYGQAQPQAAGPTVDMLGDAQLHQRLILSQLAFDPAMLADDDAVLRFAALFACDDAAQAEVNEFFRPQFLAYWRTQFAANPPQPPALVGAQFTDVARVSLDTYDGTRGGFPARIGAAARETTVSYHANPQQRCQKYRDHPAMTLRFVWAEAENFDIIPISTDAAQQLLLRVNEGDGRFPRRDVEVERTMQITDMSFGGREGRTPVLTFTVRPVGMMSVRARDRKGVMSPPLYLFPSDAPHFVARQQAPTTIIDSVDASHVEQFRWAYTPDAAQDDAAVLAFMAARNCEATRSAVKNEFTLRSWIDARRADVAATQQAGDPFQNRLWSFRQRVELGGYRFGEPGYFEMEMPTIIARDERPYPASDCRLEIFEAGVAERYAAQQAREDILVRPIQLSLLNPEALRRLHLDQQQAQTLLNLVGATRRLEVEVVYQVIGPTGLVGGREQPVEVWAAAVAMRLWRPGETQAPLHEVRIDAGPAIAAAQEMVALEREIHAQSKDDI